MGETIGWQRDGYELLATPHCFLARFEAPPELEPREWQLGDGSTMRAGDEFVRIGGRNTSAAFVTIHLREGWLIYAGTHRGFAHLTRAGEKSDELVLFRYSEVEDPCVFYGGFPITLGGPLSLTFTTRAISSRLIETTWVERR